MSIRAARLRTQVSLAMLLSAGIALTILILGMIGFYSYLQQQWVQGLDSSNRETLEALVAREAVDPDALTTLIGAFSLSWADGYIEQELLVLFGFVVISLVSSALIGVIVAGRLSRPIELVAFAARQVTAGSFDAEVEVTVGQSLEALELMCSFNTMTASLKRAELEASGSAAAIAHELRTPLTILRGRLQGIADGAFEPSPDLLLALIAQVDTLSAIVDDLATLTNLTAARGDFERYFVDLADIAHRVLMSVADDINAVGIDLETDLNAAPTNASPERMGQALNALIQNVIRYAADGGYLHVATGRVSEGVFLKVIDNGPGIPVEHRERVFERWWREDESRSRAKGGSGLGLSVVKAIVDAHGGETILSTSPDGIGSDFTIIIPD